MKKYITWIIEFFCITAIGLIPVYFFEMWYLLLLPIIGLIFLKIYEYRMDESTKLEKVKIQIDLMWRLLKFDVNHSVRCTYHKAAKKKYEQIFDYTPNGGGKGRTFSLEKGLVAKCIELKRLVIESFDSPAEYRSKMIEKYNYTTKELQERSMDRRSYLCYPLVDNYSNKVMGVVYFDSVSSNVFSDSENDPRNTTIKEVVSSIHDTLK